MLVNSFRKIDQSVGWPKNVHTCTPFDESKIRPKYIWSIRFGDAFGQQKIHLPSLLLINVLITNQNDQILQNIASLAKF